MKKPLVLLLSALASACAMSASSVTLPPSSLDMGILATASNQRMLSQRVLKAYVQTYLQVQPEKAPGTVQQALNELRSNGAMLRQAAPSAAATLVNQQGRLIDQLAGIVAQPAAQATIGQALKASEDLLANAESVTKACASTGASAPAALLGMASRQRMLSQRAAAMYLLQQTPAKSADVRKRLNEADDEFKGMIAAFEDHKGDFPGIGSNLDLAKMQMVFFDNAVHNLDNPSREHMQSVATSSDRILSQMDELTLTVQKRLSEQAAPVKTAKK